MNYSDHIVRSATLENLAYEDGVVDVGALVDMYKKLSARTIITGFVYVSEDGRAMHPGQAGMANDRHEEAWRKAVSQVKAAKPDVTLMMQLAHVGRQTIRPHAVGASKVKCSYFKNKVKPLKVEGIDRIISDFRNACLRAQRAGFDGVQIHAAHGYLIHQFLSPHTNRRRDEYAEKTLFLKRVLEAARDAVGSSFLIWLKMSHADDRGLAIQDTIAALKEVEHLADGVEVSYGTMEHALNIIRGGVPIKKAMEINPLFTKRPAWVRFLWKKFVYPSWRAKLKPFSPNYNSEAAIEISKHVAIPVMVTGGVRSGKDIHELLNAGIGRICMARPFICEPGLVSELDRDGKNWISKCTNCNLCTIYCDSPFPTFCHQRR